jgi:hypothetical protein
MHIPDPSRAATKDDVARSASAEHSFALDPSGACPTLNTLGEPPRAAEVIARRWQGDGANLEANPLRLTPPDASQSKLTLVDAPWRETVGPLATADEALVAALDHVAAGYRRAIATAGLAPADLQELSRRCDLAVDQCSRAHLLLQGPALARLAG